MSDWEGILSPAGHTSITFLVDGAKVPISKVSVEVQQSAWKGWRRKLNWMLVFALSLAYT